MCDRQLALLKLILGGIGTAFVDQMHESDSSACCEWFSIVLGWLLSILTHIALLTATINTILAYCAAIGVSFNLLTLAFLHRRWRFDGKRMRIAAARNSERTINAAASAS